MGDMHLSKLTNNVGRLHVTDTLKQCYWRESTTLIYSSQTQVARLVCKSNRVAMSDRQNKCWAIDQKVRQSLTLQSRYITDTAINNVRPSQVLMLNKMQSYSYPAIFLPSIICAMSSCLYVDTSGKNMIQSNYPKLVCRLCFTVFSLNWPCYSDSKPTVYMKCALIEVEVDVVPGAN